MATLTELLQHELEAKGPLLSAETKRILLKETLQAYVLDFLYNHRFYRGLNFYGGACLHFVYGLNRLSEDLDFDNSAGIELGNLAEDLKAMFQNKFAYHDASAKPQRSAQGILRITLKFPVSKDLGISSHPNEALHLKVEVSHHKQVAEIRKTPVFQHGRSFVPAHFSLETMMAGKMLACLERSFQRGDSGAFIKGRDFYDLLWFMQKGIKPLEEKLTSDGNTPYTVRTAMQALHDKINQIRVPDLAIDLLPLFESRTFVEAWLESFHTNFERFVGNYVD
jgi:predicted nucleotidyltransferase component of viral defense system